MDDFQSVLELVPDAKSPVFMIGVIYINMSEYTRAIESLNQSVELAPNVGQPYHYRGIAKHNLEMYEEGCYDLKKAIDLGLDYVQEIYDENCK